MKHYFVNYPIVEGIPDYEFVIKARTLKDACDKAEEIILRDYPDNWEEKREDYRCEEITAEELLRRMTIN